MSYIKPHDTVLYCRGVPYLGQFLTTGRDRQGNHQVTGVTAFKAGEGFLGNGNIANRFPSGTNWLGCNASECRDLIVDCFYGLLSP